MSMSKEHEQRPRSKEQEQGAGARSSSIKKSGTHKVENKRILMIMPMYKRERGRVLATASSLFHVFKQQNSFANEGCCRSSNCDLGQQDEAVPTRKRP